MTRENWEPSAFAAIAMRSPEMLGHLGSLPPLERDILMLHYGQGMRLGEVARDIGVGINRTRRLKWAALEKLKASFGGQTAATMAGK